MSGVFADTFFFLALLNEDDPAHQRALTASAEKKSIVTTEFILLELGNACARVEDHADFLALVAGMRASSRMTIVPLQTRLLARGLDLMGSRSDKNSVAHRLHLVCCNGRAQSQRGTDGRSTF